MSTFFQKYGLSLVRVEYRKRTKNQISCILSGLINEIYFVPDDMQQTGDFSLMKYKVASAVKGS